MSTGKADFIGGITITYTLIQVWASCRSRSVYEPDRVLDTRFLALRPCIVWTFSYFIPLFKSNIKLLRIFSSPY